MTYNGGQIYDPYHKKTLYGKPISRKLITPIFAEAHRRGLYIHTYSPTEIFTETDCPELHHYAANTLMSYEIVENVSEALPEEPYKLLAIHETDIAHLEAFRDYIKTAYAGILDSFFSSATYLEIVPTGISKGFAVKWMCDFLQIRSRPAMPRTISPCSKLPISALSCVTLFRVLQSTETTSRPLITIMTESRRSFINLSWMTE